MRQSGCKPGPFHALSHLEPDHELPHCLGQSAPCFDSSRPRGHTSIACSVALPEVGQPHAATCNAYRHRLLAELTFCVSPLTFGPGCLPLALRGTCVFRDLTSRTKRKQQNQNRIPNSDRIRKILLIRSEDCAIIGVRYSHFAAFFQSLSRSRFFHSTDTTWCRHGRRGPVRQPPRRSGWGLLSRWQKSLMARRQEKSPCRA